MTEKMHKKEINKPDKTMVDKVNRNDLEGVPKKTHEYIDHCLSVVPSNKAGSLGFRCKTEQGRSVSNVTFVYSTNLELLGLLDIVKADLLNQVTKSRDNG